MAVISSIKTKWKNLRRLFTTIVFNTTKDTKGNSFSENKEWTPVQAANSNNKYVVLALRIQAGNPDYRIQLTAMTGLAGTNDDYLVEFWVNPTVAGPPLGFNPVFGSVSEIASAIAANQVNPANSRKLFSLYRHERTAESVEIPRAEEFAEGDVIVMTVQGRTNALQFYGGMIWDEYNVNLL